MMGMIGQFSPVRIQLKRKRGWRMPPNTVKVDRTTAFGNPFKAPEYSPAEAALEFQKWLNDSVITADAFKRYLRGKNLACWCRLCLEHKDGKPLDLECIKCESCHADVLLEMANS
jgi:hypothetical protein